MSFVNHFQYATHIGGITIEHQFTQTQVRSDYKHRHNLDKIDKGYKQAFSRKASDK